MKKTLFFLGFLCLLIQPIGADVIDQEHSEELIKQFLGTMDGVTGSDLVLDRIMTVTSSTDQNKPLFYIYNTHTGGGNNGRFIIIASDSRVRQILAYGDNLLDINDMPEGLQEMIDIYRQQIESLVGNNNNGNYSEAVRMPSCSLTASLPFSTEPLLSTTWGQGTPFNNMCPEYDGKRSSTGCASTALSMIFHYHNHANLAEAVPGYTTHSLGIELQPLQPVNFDWENMIDLYQDSDSTTEQADAVALLMRYTGQAVEMDYAPGNSSAYIPKICQAINRFGYTQQRMLFNDQYDDQTWGNKIQEELQAERPVLYCASTSSQSGHVFIIDGYHAFDDTYHVNWGWNGNGNCHCALNAFKPSNSSSVYNVGQTMIVNIKPAEKLITVDQESLSFEEFTGYSQTKTFIVNGLNLTQDVELQLANVSGLATYSVTPSVITPAEATWGQTVTVKYTPWASGESSAELILASNEIEPVMVYLSGNGTKATAAISVDSTTIIINDEVNLSSFPTLLKCIEIPIKINRVFDDVMLSGPASGRLGYDPNTANFDVDFDSFCSYQLDGDSCYTVGMETHIGTYHDVPLEDPIYCKIKIFYDFRTFGQHNATLTIRGKKIASIPVVVNLLGNAVWPSDMTYIYGDMNGDGTVDVCDVTLLINYLLGMDCGINEQAANMNHDSDIDISDVTELINFVLNN